GLVTKAVMASQSLRISRASARALAASASSLRRQARLRRPRMGLRARAPSCLGAGVYRPANFTREPVAEAGGVLIVALDEGDAFGDQMREAALAALVAAVDYITVGHQPAQEGLADKIADLFSAPAGDLEHGGRRTQGDPKPAQMATLLATLFGQVTVRLPRFRCAACGAIEVGVDWPSHCRSTPELDQLQAHLAALMTYRTAADVLEQMFPVGAGNDK